MHVVYYTLIMLQPVHEHRENTLLDTNRVRSSIEDTIRVKFFFEHTIRVRFSIEDTVIQAQMI